MTIFRATAAVWTLGLWLAGCGGTGTPEDEIRAFVSKAEESAEARDASALVGLVAPDYRDGSGRDAEEIRRFVRGYLLMHQSIRLLTRIEEIDLKGPDVARLRVVVGMLGRESDVESAWDLAADVYEFDVTLARENGDWRVTRADWRRGLGR